MRISVTAGSSAELLLAQLVADRDIPPEELARMRKIWEKLEQAEL